jgi:outer membrane protein OmpA-like peptidoglycan-associated protein
MQAEKAFELAARERAAEHVPQIYHEAKIALAQAQAYGTHTTRTKSILDFSRRAVSLSSEAIAGSIRRKEAVKLEQQIEERRREMEAIQAKAKSAEADAAQAQQELTRVQAEAQAQRQVAEASLTETRIKLEQAQAEAAGQQAAAAAAMAKAREDLDRLESQRTTLEQQQAGLQASVAELGAEAEKLRAEREQLASRLQGALSKVAETQSSVRGLIVNLPDILFATNEATLKPEAREVIALTGILPSCQLNLRVEGHTDATGGDSHNQRLSEKRAASVRDFRSPTASTLAGSWRPVMARFARGSTTPPPRGGRRTGGEIVSPGRGEAAAPTREPSGRWTLTAE